MRRLVFVAAAAVLVLPAAWSRQEQQQGQPSQTQQSSTAQGQDQGKPQSSASQDSLAEAARKAREQKKEAPKAAKVFTNENIPTEGGISSVGTQAATVPAPTEAGATPSAQTAPSGEKPSAATAPSNDEKSWRDRFAKLRHKLEQDQDELAIMQRELGVLDTQYYSDPMKAMQQGMNRDDINKKTAAIEAKKKLVEDDKRAIADAEDELRKSGGDPGWASQ